MQTTDDSIKLQLVMPVFDQTCELPVFSTRIPAGFPSPADGYMDNKLDMNHFLIKHPSATFCFWVEGNSMTDVGIFDGDLLIVDCSLTPENNDIVVAVIDGEFTVKQIQRTGGKLYMAPRNPNYKPIEINEFMNFQIRGVVTKSIHQFRK